MKINTEQLRSLAQLRKAYQDADSQKELNQILEQTMKTTQEILAQNGINWTLHTNENSNHEIKKDEMQQLTTEEIIKALDDYLTKKNIIRENTPKQITVKQASELYNIPL